MKLITSLVFIILFHNILYAQNFEMESEQIHQQFIEYKLATPPADSLVGKYLHDMCEDGTWEYVDYKSTRRGSWPTTDHLVYIDEMSRSYAHPASDFYQNKQLKDAILKGIQHWLDAEYKNENWYPIFITAPRHTLRSFLYLGDEIPKSMKNEAWIKMFKRLHMNRHGSNNVIAAEIEIMKAIFYNKKEIMEKAVEIIWSEVRLTTDQGIQPDWCFHQHGNQQQIGNYGRSYSSRVTEWAYLLRGTSYALPKDKLEIHRNFLVNAPARFLWKGKMDINASGRQYKIGDLEKKYDDFYGQLILMQKIDPMHEALYKQLTEKPEEYTGCYAFWRSDLVVHRQKNWMASLSMSSSRVVGTELCNMENFTGVHLGDGRLLVTQSGDEYHHIAPLWDWNRLPGTTCDQKLDTLIPQKKTRTISEYAGVIDNTKSGIAAMHYKRNNLQAKKSWFFTENAIVCLGAGISGQTNGNVFTSIEQSNLMGEIHSSQGALKQIKTSIKTNAWIHHNNIGYHIFDKVTVTTSDVKDNWQKCFPTYEDITAEGSVFSIYIDHGKNPDTQAYAYCIYPDIEAEKMEKTILRSKINIVSNTETVQAVQYQKQLMAVFYKPGKLKVDDKTTVKVDAPCLLMLNKKEIQVSDPIHKSTDINIKINEKIYNAKLPQDEQKGNSVVIVKK